MRLSPLSVILGSALAALLLWAVGAWAQPGWVLWVETPVGSDQWSVASPAPARFAAKADCEHRAEQLNGMEAAIGKMHRADGEAVDVFTCLPGAVDPRPEGALR